MVSLDHLILVLTQSSVPHKTSNTLTTPFHGNLQPSFFGVKSYNPYFEGLKPSFFNVLGSKDLKGAEYLFKFHSNRMNLDHDMCC